MADLPSPPTFIINEGPGSPLPTPTNQPPLHLSVTRTWGNRTLPIASPEWRALRESIIVRNNRTCASCAYASHHPQGRGLKIDHIDGDASNNELSNLRIHCPPCEAVRHCGLSGIKGWLELAKSDMDQVEIVRKTRESFQRSGILPRIQQVDPLATPTEIRAVDFANRLMESDWEGLTKEEKGLRGFFTNEAVGLFLITLAPRELHHISSLHASNQSYVQAPLIFAVEHSLPRVHFSPEAHTSLQNFLTTWAPSTTSQSDVEWICIENARLKAANTPSALDVTSLRQAWDEKRANGQASVADLDELARRFEILNGKWMMFPTTSDVDRLWSLIARSTHAGTLGVSAKVSSKDGPEHLICVYSGDYTNEADVNKVRAGLRRLGVKERISYKPDIYTYCHIYMGNSWNIPPSRYHG